MHFASDNTAPAHPRVIARIAAADDGPAMPYGADALTARATDLLCETFGAEAAFLVTTGTAANALALSALVPPYGAVFCHEQAHVNTDECGAPEFFTGGAKLLPLPGPDGRLRPQTLTEALATFVHGAHQVLPAAVSVTNATELGAVYAPEEMAALSALAHARGLAVHIDGARLANALAATGAAPRAMTAEAGIDALSFGLTKNGAMMAEAVLFFNEDHAREFDRRRKRAGQLVSKARYIAAQFLALMESDLWLELAAHANRMAADLAAGLSTLPQVELLHEARTNELFVRLPRALHERLRQAGATYYLWQDDPDHPIIRLVTSWATPPHEVEDFLATLAAG